MSCGKSCCIAQVCLIFGEQMAAHSPLGFSGRVFMFQVVVLGLLKNKKSIRSSSGVCPWTIIVQHLHAPIWHFHKESYHSYNISFFCRWHSVVPIIFLILSISCSQTSKLHWGNELLDMYVFILDSKSQRQRICSYLSCPSLKHTANKSRALALFWTVTSVW